MDLIVITGLRVDTVVGAKRWERRVRQPVVLDLELATDAARAAHTDDPAAAARHLEQRGVQRCDAVEELPEGFPGFWIRSPAGQVHLVCAEESP